MTTITEICPDCESTEVPCNCCEWCEMFPCECTDDDDDNQVAAIYFDGDYE